MALVNLLPDLGGAFGYELRTGPRAKIGLGRGRGSATGSIGRAVAWLLIEGGEGELAIDGTTTEVGGRDDVFERAGWSAIVPPKTRIAIRGNLRYTLVWRAWDKAVELRVIAPDQVTRERRGSGPDKRAVRTYVGEGPLIVGETLNEPGRWSSWPPHRHEQEEVYLFRFDPSHGFGVLVLPTAAGGDRATVVRDGHVERIRAGYHPAVAAPGAAMYYLWALAGKGGSLRPEVDPTYA